MAADNLRYVNKLQGKRVLVIGGTSGIGFTTAEALVENGVGSLFVSSSNPERVKTAIFRLKSSYPTLSQKTQISGHACDLGTEATLEQNIKQLLDACTDQGSKKLDHIVYTAGDSLLMIKVSDITLDAAKKAGMVRFFGPIMLGKLAPKYMNAGPESSIVLTTGSVSERPRPDWAVVGAFATGLHGLTRGLALDLAPLRVNLISPGAVDTELWNGLPEQQREAMKKKMSDTMPTGRMGHAEDVAQSYIYCLTDYNVTGIAISSNSGFHLK